MGSNVLIKMHIIFLLMLLFPIDGFSQYKNELDSILVTNNPDNFENNILKAELYYKCALLSNKYVKLTGAGLNKQASLGSGLKVSLLIGYTNGIKKYYELLPFILGQKEMEIFIYIKPYHDFVSEKKMKELYRSGIKMHGGSIDVYSDLIHDSVFRNSFSHLHKIYLWRGLIYLDWENSDFADKHFKEAERFALRNQDTSYLSKILIFRGYAKWKQNKPDSAMYFFNKSLAISSIYNDSVKIASANNNLGQICFQQKRYTHALKYFKIANQFCPDHFQEKTNVLLHMAKTYLSMGRYGDAWQILRLIENKVKSANNNQAMSDFLFYKALFYEKSGNVAEAYKRYKLFENFKDSVFVDEVEKFHYQKISKISNELGANISQKNIEYIKNKRANITLNRTNIILWLLATGSALILLIVLLLGRALIASRKAKKYLDELNENKNTFLSIISHDLRSPLAAFIQILEPLQQDLQTIPTEKLGRYLSEIDKHTKNCYLLLGNLLQWSKTMKNLKDIKWEKLNLKKIVDLNIAIYQTIASKKNISLKSEIDEKTHVMADLNMIELIVRNLIDNAIKNMPENGHLLIYEKPHPNYHVICFRDDGEGLKKADFEYLTGSSWDSTYHELKTGLGLNLCKEFIAVHGGKLLITSDGEGKGSCFSFTIKKDGTN